jgi:hypothetical protein
MRAQEQVSSNVLRATLAIVPASQVFTGPLAVQLAPATMKAQRLAIPQQEHAYARLGGMVACVKDVPKTTIQLALAMSIATAISLATEMGIATHRECVSAKRVGPPHTVVVAPQTITQSLSKSQSGVTTLLSLRRRYHPTIQTSSIIHCNSKGHWI